MSKKVLNDITDIVIETAWEILRCRSLLALGKHEDLPEEYHLFDHKEEDNILRLVQPLLSTSQQTKKISAETSQDIVKLIKLGKLSLTEAKELMALTGARIEVEGKELKLKMQQKMMDMLDIEE
jgi:polyhydroxyalkanoate synthesis regulator phasin